MSKVIIVLFYLCYFLINRWYLADVHQKMTARLHDVKEYECNIYFVEILQNQAFLLEIDIFGLQQQI